jgi:sodium/bile acid cotransporter 7
MIDFVKKYWFLVSLVAVEVFAFLFPQAASLNAGNRITAAMVMLIFLGIGLTLPSECFVTGLKKWKIHLFIQLYIFVFNPVFFFFTAALLKGHVFTELYVGLLALAVLPTTISSCTVFTQINNGDVATTLINASLSNILGVFVSPMLLSLLLQGTGKAMPISVLVGIVAGLGLKMVLPLFAGQVFRFIFFRSNDKLNVVFGILNNIMVLVIVFFSLAKSASAQHLTENVKMLLLPVVYLVVVHFLLTAISVGFAKLFKYEGPEIISVMYTAPQKTLAMGVPLLSMYFADDAVLMGIAILPLLFYHPWELFVSGVLKSLSTVKEWGRE